MCEPESSFRFCTCADGAELAPPMWLLERRDVSLDEQHRRGRVALPKWSKETLATRESLLEALREGSCFDFEYEPADGDVLSVWIGSDPQPLRFRYLTSLGSAGWTIDSSSGLTHWRSQMVEVRSGPLEADPT